MLLDFSPPTKVRWNTYLPTFLISPTAFVNIQPDSREEKRRKPHIWLAQPKKIIKTARLNRRKFPKEKKFPKWCLLATYTTLIISGNSALLCFAHSFFSFFLSLFSSMYGLLCCQNPVFFPFFFLLRESITYLRLRSFNRHSSMDYYSLLIIYHYQNAKRGWSFREYLTRIPPKRFQNWTRLDLSDPWRRIKA